MMKFHEHNKVPDELKKYLGWANATISSNQVLLHFQGNFDCRKQIGQVRNWIAAHCLEETHMIPSSDITVLAIMPMDQAALMRLELVL